MTAVWYPAVWRLKRRTSFEISTAHVFQEYIHSLIA